MLMVSQRSSYKRGSFLYPPFGIFIAVSVSCREHDR